MQRPPCPPIASKGIFKVLTFFIPVAECSDHRTRVLSWIIAKLKWLLAKILFFASFVPSVVSHLQNLNIGNGLLAKFSLLVTVIKPALDRVIEYTRPSSEPCATPPPETFPESKPPPAVVDEELEPDRRPVENVASGWFQRRTRPQPLQPVQTIYVCCDKTEEAEGRVTWLIAQVKYGASAAFEFFKNNASAGFGFVKNGAYTGFDYAKYGASTGFDYVKNGASGGFSYGKGLVSAGYCHAKNGISTGYGHAKNGASAGLGYAKSGASAGFDYAKNGASAGFGYAKNGASAVVGFFKNGASAGFGYAKSGASAGFGYAKSGASAGFSYAKSGASAGFGYVKSASSAVAGFFKNAASSIGGFFKSVASSVSGFFSGVKNAGSNAVGSLTSCPLWVYAYILFVLMLIGYIAYETYETYQGMMWYLQNKVPDKIREGCKDLILPDTTLKEVMRKLRGEIDKGLNPKTKSSSSVKCFTTYVQDLPTGQENGRFLALDLGGTNFRVLLITLNGRHFDMQSKIYAIPQNVMVGTSENLFSHIAQCLLDFTKEHRVNKEGIPLGFTFSFPLRQEGLTKGILQRWTKGFDCPEAVGEDVVELLKEAIEKRGDELKIDIMAVLNDTTGTLMSCAWKNHNTKIGVILGTGTNACYVEKIENVINFDGDKSKPYVLINTEWGAFGDNGELEFIRTRYDKEVDKNSINPGLQLHEKLISGMYLGEIVRLLMIEFINDNLLLDGKISEKIEQYQSIATKFLSEVESDKKGVFKNCRKALGELGYSQVSDEDCNSVRYICECVSRRAAHLASAGLSTLINKMGYPSLTIGVDGSLYRYHPHFHDLMVEKMSQLIDDKIMNVNLMLSEDGSGRGAALVAASVA